MALTQKKHAKLVTRVIFLSVMFGFIITAHAQEVSKINSFLNYPQSNSLVLYGFGNNPSEMSRLNQFMNFLLQDSTSARKSNILITGYSSPDGPLKDNEHLANERVINLKAYLDQAFNLSSKTTVTTNIIAEDWEGLQRQLSSVDYPYNKQIGKIITKNSDLDKREKKIKSLFRGHVYRDLCNNHFPLLRRVEITVEKTSKDSISVDSIPLNNKIKHDLSPVTFPAVKSEDDVDGQLIRSERQSRMYQNDWTRRRHDQMSSQDARYSYSMFRQPRDFFPKMALKTNLLALAGFNPDFKYTTFIPNACIEFYLKKKWSLELSMAYSNWSYKNNERFQGISAYTIEPRYWLKNNGEFNKFFIGTYLQFGDYNLQEHHDILASEGNRTGKYQSAGLSVGYLQPIFNRIAAEISFRVGYRHSNVKEYRRDEDLNIYKYSHNQNDFDITGSRLNIMYRF